jgi:hypothetical protein
MTPTPTATPTETPTPTPTSELIDNPVIQKGLELLADALGTEKQEFVIRGVGKVDWPDSCLGLGESGEVCEQVVVPGYWVLVEYELEVYQIRTSADGSEIRWEKGSLPFN